MKKIFLIILLFLLFLSIKNFAFATWDPNKETTCENRPDSCASGSPDSQWSTGVSCESRCPRDIYPECIDNQDGCPSGREVGCSFMHVQDGTGNKITWACSYLPAGVTTTTGPLTCTGTDYQCVVEGPMWTDCPTNKTNYYDLTCQKGYTCCGPISLPAPQTPELIKKCPICRNGFFWIGGSYQSCDGPDDFDYEDPVYYTDCSKTGICYEGCGCETLTCQGKYADAAAPACEEKDPTTGVCLKVKTSLPGISFGTDAAGFVKSLFGLILGLSGGLALILIMISGYKIIFARGNPEKMQGARESLTAAIVGLLFIIFSLVILEVIGVNILQLPTWH
jgi:hypothetical protein